MNVLLPPPAAAPSRTQMTPFVKLTRDASSAMIQRNMLLSQPTEFFMEFFGGRAPTLNEKLCWVEEKVQQVLTWETYRNDIYQVVVERTTPLIHLCIRRHDGEACKEWKHHQQIKNEIIGPEYEAVELFPAESRLIDTTNEYHLWVHPTPSYRFPFGFSFHRMVMQKPLSVAGALGAA
jgi:hypothetical protein